MIGFSELLQSETAGRMSSEQREYLGTIQRNGEHLLGLISDLLDLTKVDLGLLELENRAFDL